eukprot:c19027_g1_i1 orf=464-700(-)
MMAFLWKSFHSIGRNLAPHDIGLPDILVPHAFSWSESSPLQFIEKRIFMLRAFVLDHKVARSCINRHSVVKKIHWKFQ